MKLYWLIIIALVMTLSGCGGLDSPFNCFAAATPISLKLDNDYSDEKVLTIIYKDKESSFDRIGTIKIDGNSEKTICLEAEGYFEKGLFIYYENITHKIVINQSSEYQLKLSDTTSRISNSKDLDYLLDPKW